MTRKRFWVLVACAGVVLFVGGLILTIVLASETGHEVPDSQCDSSMGAVRSADVFQATCIVSDDPKVLLGVLPMLLGAGMTGIGIWRAVVAGMNEGSDDSDGSSGFVGGLMGSLKQLQEQGEAMQAQGAALQAGVGVPGTPGAAGADPATMQTSVEQAQALQKQAMEMAEKAGILNPDGTPKPPGSSTAPPPDPPTPPAPESK